MTTEFRSKPQQYRSEQTLASLTAAARVAADTFGYDRFTTADVASIAGRSIGTVYRYFPDRVALLDAIDSGRRVAADVRAERAQQDAKWGEQNHPDGTGGGEYPLATTGGEIGLEEYEAHSLSVIFTRNTDDRFSRTRSTELGTWRDILLEEVFEALSEWEPSKLRAELVQVAAVAQQWAEAIDRRAV